MSEDASTDYPKTASDSTEDLEQIARLNAQRAERRRVVDAMRASFCDVSPEEIERETAKAVAEVQAEMRTERIRRRNGVPQAPSGCLCCARAR